MCECTFSYASFAHFYGQQLGEGRKGATYEGLQDR
jgi:hypothetical protein